MDPYIRNRLGGLEEMGGRGRLQVSGGKDGKEEKEAKR